MEKIGLGKQPPSLPKPVRITEQVWPEGTVPLVSIFCITYNHEKFIRDAIEGFLMQETTFPVEIFIHDDASTDNTKKIIKRYAKKYPKLFWTVIQKENHWSMGNKVWVDYLKKQRGQFVAFCEGDDYWISKKKLQMQIKTLLKKPDLSMCFHNAFEKNQDTGEQKIFNREFTKAEFFLEDMFLHSFVIPTASMVFRRSLLRGYTTLKKFLVGDRPIQILLADRGPFRFINKPLSVYRKHQGGMMQKLEKNYEKNVIPGFIKMYYKLNEMTKGVHRNIIEKEIMRLAWARVRIEHDFIWNEQKLICQKKDLVREKMKSPFLYARHIKNLYANIARILRDPQKKEILNSRKQKDTMSELIFEVGNYWYRRKEWSKAAEFYLYSFKIDGKNKYRKVFIYFLAEIGWLGRIIRSLCGRLSAFYQKKA